MVSYHSWVSIVFDTAKSKGAKIESTEDSRPVMSTAAEIWNDRKDELDTASESKAKQIATEEITVR